MDYIRYVGESERRSRQDDEEFTMGKRLWVEA